MRKPSESDGNGKRRLAPNPAYRGFAAVLCELLDGGARAGMPPGSIGTPWSPKEFGGGDRDEKTVRNYRNAVTLPGPADMRWIEAKLFGPGGTVPEGQRRLRDAWRRAGGLDEPAPPPPAPAPGTVEPPDRCFGRDAQLAELVAALTGPADDGTPQACVVLGDGGIGKTTLSRAVATHPAVTARFGAAIHEATLDTALGGAADMQARIAQALGIDPAQGFDAVLARLAQAGPTLLLLDNLETPWEAAPREVEALLRRLAAIPGLALLASQRGNEAPASPRWRRQCRLAPLSLDESRRLFRDVAPAIAGDDPLLAPFLRDLAGIPLAIWLVARGADLHGSLADLWQDWQARGPEAARDARVPADHRHATLARSIEVSLRPGNPRLDARGRLLFRLLGALPDGMARQDREALLGEPAAEEEARHQLLRVGLAIWRGDRLDLLPPLRRHAAARHQPAPAEAAAWVAHYLRLVTTEGVRVGADGGREAAARLAPEAANLDAALRAAAAGLDVPGAVAAAWGYADFARFTGLAGAALAPLAAACHRLGDTAGEAAARFEAALIAAGRSDHAAARRGFEAARPLYERAGDLLGEANCIRGLAEIALARAEHDAARRGYEEARPLFERAGSLLGEANCIRGLADIARDRAEHDAARRGYQAARTLFERAGDLLGEANCILCIAEIARARAEHDAARRGYEEARALFERAGSLVGEANCIQGLADIARDRAEHDAARRGYEEARPLFERAGDLLGEANCIKGLADIALARAEHDAARRGYEAARTLYERAGALLGEANCIKGLADIALTRAEHDAARRGYEAARPLYERAGSLIGEANCIQGLADIARDRAEHDAARRGYEEARPLYERAGNQVGPALCLAGLGALAGRAGDTAAARGMIEEAVATFDRIGSAQNARWARGLLAALPG